MTASGLAGAREQGSRTHVFGPRRCRMGSSAGVWFSRPVSLYPSPGGSSTYYDRLDERSLGFLEVEFANGVVLFVLVEILGALTALGIGIVLSLFAENEFQAIQFIPVVITPQVILGGTFLPVEDLPVYLEYPARAMPITYLIDAMEYVVLDRGTADEFGLAIVVLLGFVVLSIGIAGVVVGRAG